MPVSQISGARLPSISVNLATSSSKKTHVQGNSQISSIEGGGFCHIFASIWGGIKGFFAFLFCSAQPESSRPKKLDFSVLDTAFILHAGKRKGFEITLSRKDGTPVLSRDYRYREHPVDLELWKKDVYLQMKKKAQIGDRICVYAWGVADDKIRYSKEWGKIKESGIELEAMDRDSFEKNSVKAERLQTASPAFFRDIQGHSSPLPIEPPSLVSALLGNKYGECWRYEIGLNRARSSELQKWGKKPAKDPTEWEREIFEKLQKRALFGDKIDLVIREDGGYGTRVYSSTLQVVPCVPGLFKVLSSSLK